MSQPLAFPQYIPVSVQRLISIYLEGDETEPHGYRHDFESAEAQLVSLDRELVTARASGPESELDELRRQRAEAEEHRALLARWVTCLERLGTDPRMEDVFLQLCRQCFDEQQQCKFVRCAWGAASDYSRYRARIRKARELTKSIATAAAKLSGLLQAAEETGLPTWPAEFFDIRILLQKSENTAHHGHNLNMWRSMRKHITLEGPEERGRLPVEPATEDGPPATVASEFAREEHQVGGSSASTTKDIAYAWSVAPEFSALLDVLADAARDTEPSESGFIRSAIQSRQHNAKTEFVRAIAHRLDGSSEIPFSNPLFHAIAMVAPIAMDDSEPDVTYDDVRKALSQMKMDGLQNSN